MTNYCLVGIPGSGKSYFGTQRIVKHLGNWYRAARKKKDPSMYPMCNYPVQHPVYGGAIRWSPELMYYPLQNAYMVIDEAYQYFGQNNKKNYKLDYEVFFGTVRHNNIDIVNIAHGMTRINPDIRIKSEVFYVIEKVCFPFTGKPFFFKLTGYYDMNFSKNKSVEPISHEILFFKKSVARCYDTRYMRKQPFDMTQLPRWGEDFVNKKSLQDITNWTDDNLKWQRDIKPIMNKYDNVIDAQEAGVTDITQKECDKRASNGEVCFWDDTVIELKDLKGIVKT